MMQAPAPAGMTAADPHRAALEACARSPVPALLATVADLHRALLAHQPARLKRSVGWWGRLLGRDIALQAESLALREQLAVHLRRASTQLVDVQAFRGTLSQHQLALRDAAAAMEACTESDTGIDATRDAAAPALAGEQRLHHARTMAQAYRLTAAHLHTLTAQYDALLAHLAQSLPRMQVLADQARLLSDRQAHQAAVAATRQVEDVLRTVLAETPASDTERREPDYPRSSP